MKTIFEPADFERDDHHRMSGAVLRQVTAGDRGEHLGEPWLIGSVTVMDTDKEARKKRWVRVSLLDGMVVGPMTAEDMCVILNEKNYRRIVTPLSLGKEIEEGQRS